ncbi:MAG: RnfABCDGE type electron transport complex subunit G, partial [Endomicrobiia bacterium]
MNLLKLAGTLSVVCLLSGLSLSYFYTKTKPNITKNIAQKELRLKQEIISNAKKFNKLDLIKNFLSVEESIDEKDEMVGFLIKNKTKGYGGDIEYLLGISFEKEPRIINLKILSHKETPGLGAKITSTKFLSQYISKIVSDLYLKKDSAEGRIDSITGATITSRAITNSVRKILEDEELQKVIKTKISDKRTVSETEQLPTTPIIEKKKPINVSHGQKYETLSSTKTNTIEEN